MNYKDKNLIYIFADQWRREAIGFYNPEVKTPNIDKLMNEGFVFDRAYSSCPVCSPHRACLMSGKYPLSNGVFTNCKTGLDIELNENDVCIGDVLKDAGYKTGYIGKWHLDQPSLNFSNNPKDGSEGWDAYTPPGKRRHGFDFWYSYGAHNNHLAPHYWKDSPEKIKVDEWSPQHETDVALDFLEKSQDKFALFISYNPPHSPYDLTPDKYIDLYNDITLRQNVGNNFHHHTGEEENLSIDELKKIIKEYYAAVTSLDYNIGRIVEYLKNTGKMDDTVIVISSDHGDMLGSHNLMGKYVWFEESVGIPLVFAGGGIKKGRTSKLIGSPDHAPTILGLLDINIPNEMEGKDFSNILKGKDFEGYKSIYTAGYVNTKENIEVFGKNGKNAMAYGWRSIITDRYKLAVFKGYKFGEKEEKFLYDLYNDPFEQAPVDDSEIMEKMVLELKYWVEKLDDPWEV